VIYDLIWTDYDYNEHIALIMIIMIYYDYFIDSIVNVILLYCVLVNLSMLYCYEALVLW